MDGLGAGFPELIQPLLTVTFQNKDDASHGWKKKDFGGAENITSEGSEATARRPAVDDQDLSFSSTTPTYRR